MLPLLFSPFTQPHTHTPPTNGNRNLMRYISLIEASKRSGIPYISIYRHMVRSEKKGVVEFQRYGHYRHFPLSVRVEDFHSYLHARIERQHSGNLDMRRQQARVAMTALELKRKYDQKKDNNDNKTTDTII